MSIPWKEKLRKISDKHNLHIDQAGHLGEETVLVMFGIEHANNLVANITKHAEVTEEKAEAIAEDLNREIFLKVRESLKKISEERSESGGGLLEERKDTKTTEEEILKREDILREIEDKEHHNLPAVNKTELHLGTKRPSEVEIVEKPVVVESSQTAFQNAYNKTNAAIINPTKYQAPQKPSVPQEDIVRTMEKDIFKTKMAGTVSVPKETIVINDSAPQSKTKQPSVDKKVDPYREQVGK